MRGQYYDPTSREIVEVQAFVNFKFILAENVNKGMLEIVFCYNTWSQTKNGAICSLVLYVPFFFLINTIKREKKKDHNG